MSNDGFSVRDRRTKGWFYESNGIFDQGLSKHALLVRLYLARCADGNDQAFPSLTTIGKKCGIGRSSVAEALKELEERGLVCREQRTKPGTNEPTTTLYTLMSCEGSPEYGRGVVQNTDNLVRIPNKEQYPINNTHLEKELDNISYPETGRDIPLYSEIVSYLNEKTEQTYRASSKKTQALIRSRWNEGFRLDDFKRVIDIKTAQWLNDANMCKYLRPETLFGTKFESYLNEKAGNRGGGQQGSIPKHHESVTGGQVGWHRKQEV